MQAHQASTASGTGFFSLWLLASVMLLFVHLSACLFSSQSCSLGAFESSLKTFLFQHDYQLLFFLLADDDTGHADVCRWLCVDVWMTKKLLLVVILIHMSNIWIYTISYVWLAGWLSICISCIVKPLVLNMHRLFNQICFIPDVLFDTIDSNILTTFIDLDWGWGSQGQGKVKPVGFIFLYMFWLMRMKFDVVWK